MFYSSLNYDGPRTKVFNTTDYGLKSRRYFAAKKWNELTNDIRTEVGIIEMNNKIRSLKFD